MTNSNSNVHVTPADKEMTEIMKLVVIFMFIGTLFAYLFGREPGTLPDDIVKEVAPSVIVICGFLISYELCDVMGVGMAKGRRNIMEKSYKDLMQSKEDEEVYLRQRVLTNQLEQMPLFIVGTFLCAVFVNGKVAGVLSLSWSILRRLYASTYKAGIGKKFKDIALAKYTVPCYFISNTMVMSAAIQVVRSFLR